MSKLTYKDAGVDLDVYEQAMARLPGLMRRTHTPRVIGLVGGFAGLFALNGDGRKYDDPVLVSGTDGVGTKLKVATAIGRFDTIGIDLVAMCVNDCLCLGAEPLFFLDYLALGKDDPELIAAVVAGVSAGCVEAGAALLGGETAVMPDVYAPGEFDVAGFCVGVAERARIIDGQAIRPGDVLLGLASSGFHSNGYSLLRKVVLERAGLKVGDRVSSLDRTVGDVLLEPTTIYAQAVRAALAGEGSAAVHGMAHITGGGLAENLERVLPEGCRATIRRGSWPAHPAFEWLGSLGAIERTEMERVFNMGIGYLFVVDRAAAGDVAQRLAAAGHSAHEIGTITAGERGVELVG
ncbi:MAG: phosphoribosylformylglycinamidine cyclo-ligase [Planctomycetaceae bacterium]